MKLRLLASPMCIGLDIDSASIRIVQLKKKKRRWQLERALLEPINDIKQWDSITRTLGELVQKEGLSGLPAAISLGEDKVNRQRISLPASLSDAEIEAYIEEHASSSLMGVREILCIDYVRKKSANPGMVDIQYVSVSQAYLSQYVASVNAAGLKVKVADVDEDAIHRARQFAALIGNQPEFIKALGLALREVPAWLQ